MRVIQGDGRDAPALGPSLTGINAVVIPAGGRKDPVLAEIVKDGRTVDAEERYSSAWALLAKVVPVNYAGKNAVLKHTLLVTGADGYAVSVALGPMLFPSEPWGR